MSKKKDVRQYQWLVHIFLILFTITSLCISHQNTLALTLDIQSDDSQGSFLYETDRNLASNSDTIDANLSVAEYNLKQGLWQKATIHTQRVLEKDKANSKAHGILGLIAALGGQHQVAEQQLTYFKGKKAADFYPEMITAILNGQKKNFSKASEHLAAALEKDSNHPIALYYKGSLELAQGQLNKAENTFLITLTHSPEFQPANAGLGQVYWLKKQPDKAITSYLKAIESQPETILYHQQLITIYKETNQKENADKASRKMLYFIPGVKERYIEQGLELINRGDYKEAIKLTDNLLSVYKKFPAGHYIKAVALSNLGKEKAAIKSVTKLLATGSGIAKTHHEAGLCYLALGNLEKAEAQFKRAVNINPNNSRSFIFLPVIEQLRGNNTTALSGFSVLLSQKESPPLIHYLQANTYLAEGKADEYKQELKKGQAILPGIGNDTLENLQLPTNPVAIAKDRNLMVLYYLNGWYDQAAQKSFSILKTLPSDPFALWYSGLAKFAQKKYPDAISNLTQLIQIDPNLVAAQMQRGQAYALLNDNRNALLNFTQVTEMAPSYAPAFIAIGNTHYNDGNEMKAVLAYRKAIEINPEAIDGYQPLTLLLAEKGENYDEAFRLAEKMIEISPQNPFSLDALGWVLIQRGQIRDGLGKLQTASRLLPGEPLVMYHLGMGYFRDNQPEKARQWLQTALALSDNFRGSTEAESTLKKITEN